MDLDAPSYVPYQAYKSKRHSRNFSNPQQLANNVVSSRPSSLTANMLSLVSSANGIGETKSIDVTSLCLPNGGEKLDLPHLETVSYPVSNDAPSSPKSTHSQDVASAQSRSIIASPAPPATELGQLDLQPVPATNGYASPTSDGTSSAASLSPVLQHKSLSASTSSSAPGSSSKSLTQTASPSITAIKSPMNNARKSSTFRHVPLRSPRSPLPSSPLRPLGPGGSHERSPSLTSAPIFRTHLEHASPSTNSPSPHPRGYITSRVSDSSVSNARKSTAIPVPFQETGSPSTSSTLSTCPRASDIYHPQPGHKHSISADLSANLTPPPRTTSLIATHNVSAPSSVQPQTSISSTASTPSIPTRPTSSSSTSTPIRMLAPYRPGFQPRGLYRPRTDEFIQTRRTNHEAGSLRVERTKLERRLEKLIALHFPVDGTEEGKKAHRSSLVVNRRASSFFDLDLSDLRNMSVDPGGLWRGIVKQSQGEKGEIRDAEQRITPWEEDSAVSKCPLCSASFHPLTNRKHHCRLCGKIICSLPVKTPQRPILCSFLFVVNSKTRMIEEVGEGVDYGVRRKRTASMNNKAAVKAKDEDEEDKFLKGVRICRDCRPVLLRQQYQQEFLHVPAFVRLYEVFIALEKEIEDSLPQFQELLLSLNHDDHPTKEAVAARKRLLEAFSQYDALSKRIRNLPCPAGPGSSQDRIQMAIMTRANYFLQKHMFPLQSLPKKQDPSTAKSSPTDYLHGQLVDLDAEIAHALQPLLEQEALLESFIEEAKARRKFEDVKTLKANLLELRAEIDKILANVELDRQGKGGGQGKR